MTKSFDELGMSWSQLPYLVETKEDYDNGITFTVESDSVAYQITFENYILYMTGNESYVMGHPNDTYIGKYFVEYKTSELLDHLSDFVELDLIQGPYRHYGLFCQRHTIDVISTTEPMMKEVKR